MPFIYKLDTATRKQSLLLITTANILGALIERGPASQPLFTQAGWGGVLSQNVIKLGQKKALGIKIPSKVIKIPSGSHFFSK